MNVARRARQATGLTQRAFAHLIGTSHVTVARWEAGRRLPSAPTRALLELIASLPEVCLRVLSELPDPDEASIERRVLTNGQRAWEREWNHTRR